MPDAFTLLGLPRSFDVDARALQAAYLRRSAALHPDRFTDPLQQAEAQRESAALNDARAALADDESRANLLLTLLGGPAKEQDKSLPDGFLMEMLEVRQEMEAALAGDDEAERARLEQWARDRRQQHIEAVRAAFATLPAAGIAGEGGGLQSQTSQLAAPGALAGIRRELNAWRYIERMLEQLHEPTT